MIEKHVYIDKIEILEDGSIQVREATQIVEDGSVLSTTYTNRRIIAPDHDISNESQEIQNIAKIVRTPERLEKYNAKKSRFEESIGSSRKG